MKIIKKFNLFLILILFSILSGYLLNMFVSNNFVFELKISPELLVSSKTLLYSAEIFCALLLFYFYIIYKNSFKNPKSIRKAKDSDYEIYTGLENSHFQTNEEIAKNFITIEYDKLPETDINGTPIIAEEKNKSYNITFSKEPAHTLVVGTTGSGKTTTYINPVIQILSNTKGKPSMIIADPKGELYSLHAKSLEKRGYEIKILDLRNPYCSVRWNPLEKPYLWYQEMLNIEKQVKEYEEEGYYEFEGKIFYNEDELKSLIQVRKQQLFDMVYEELNDICMALCPVTNANDKIWESGAKNFILSIMLAMLEDSENPKLNMTKEKFNFYNVMKVATNTQNDCQELINYFKERNPISKSVNLSQQVLDAGDKTRGSYLSTVFDKLSIFSDMSICSLTSANEIDFGELAEKPTALFLQIPDEKETRHILAAMVILQAYKGLVAKATTYPDLTLPRNIFFLLDEFGNLPKIHCIQKMITVGRSRKIWMTLVVQSYAQLAKVYDENVADIIKSNCNIQVFIGTTDLKTIEEFSKRCGNFSIIQRNVSFNSGNDNNGVSVSVKERPLIYPSELQLLNTGKEMGNSIISIFKFPPLRSKFTPSFKVKKFNLEKTTQLLSNGKYFNEKKVFYNLLDRNDLVISKEKKKESREDTAKEIMTSLEIQLEKFDYTELNLPDIKLYLLNSMRERDFTNFFRLLSTLEEKAKELNLDSYMNINSIKRLAEQLRRTNY